MRRIACIAISSLVVLLLAAAPSGAYVVLERTGLASSTGGIALGPDGNLWVSETGNNSVVRLRPNGDLIRRYAVGVAPGAMSVGAGGRVWVTMTGENSVGFFDATSPSPEFHSVPTGLACPSTDIAAANGQLYMAIPSSSSATCDQVGSLPDDGGTAPMSNMTSATGAVRDITFRDGTVFASGSGGNTIDRFAPGLGDTNNPVDMPGPAGPIAFDGQDRLWTASPAGNALFRLSPAGAIDTVNVLGGQLTEPNDIVDGSDGQLYATGGTSQNVVRVDPNTSHTSFFPIGGGGRPDQIINGPDGDLYITDASLSRIMRFVNGPPRTFTGPAAAVAGNAASASAQVDPRGNDTQVVFDYGTTPAYGKTSAPVTLPAGAGAVPVTSVLNDLAGSTTYHVRARASNSEGQVAGVDTTVTTPKAVVDKDGDGASPPADCDDDDATRHPGATEIPKDGIDQDCDGKDGKYPILTARAAFAWVSTSAYTKLTQVRITALQGGERGVVSCKGRKHRCPFGRRALTLRKGTRKFDSAFRKHKLVPGTRVTIRVTKKASVGSVATATIRKARAPKIVRRCLVPGSSAPRRC